MCRFISISLMGSLLAVAGCHGETQRAAGLGRDPPADTEARLASHLISADAEAPPGLQEAAPPPRRLKDRPVAGMYWHLPRR